MVVFYLATWIDQARVSSSAGASALERLGELLSLVGILRHWTLAEGEVHRISLRSDWAILWGQVNPAGLIFLHLGSCASRVQTTAENSCFLWNKDFGLLFEVGLHTSLLNHHRRGYDRVVLNSARFQSDLAEFSRGASSRIVVANVGDRQIFALLKVLGKCLRTRGNCTLEMLTSTLVAWLVETQLRFAQIWSLGIGYLVGVLLSTWALLRVLNLLF